MTRLICTVKDCKNHDGEYGCIFDEIRIKDETLTAAGFLPMCEGYEEQENTEEK